MYESSRTTDSAKNLYGSSKENKDETWMFYMSKAHKVNKRYLSAHLSISWMARGLLK